MRSYGPIVVLVVGDHIGPDGQLRNDGWLTSRGGMPGRRRPWRLRRQLPLRLQWLMIHDLKKYNNVRISHR